MTHLLRHAFLFLVGFVALAIVLMMVVTADAAELKLKDTETPVGAKSIIAPKAERVETASGDAAGKTGEADAPRQIVVEESEDKGSEKIKVATGEEAPASAPKLLSTPKPLAEASSEDATPESKAHESDTPETDVVPAPKLEQPAHQDSTPQTYGSSYAHAGYGYSYGGGYDDCD